MSFERCKADPCIFHTCIKGKLMMWSSWTDNCLCVGPKELVLEAKKKFMDRFDCMAVGDMNECVGCMMERNFDKGCVNKMMQPVLMQSLVEECKDLTEMHKEKLQQQPWIPSEAGSMLVKCEDKSEGLGERPQHIHAGLVGKVLHIMRWSRPESMAAVQDL